MTTATAAKPLAPLSKNLSLATASLPNFSQFDPADVEPAIDHLLAENRQHYQTLLAQETFNWSNLIAPIEAMEERLSRAFSPVSHLHSVADNEPLREAYNAVLPKLSAYSVELGQNRELFNAYRAIRDSDEFATLNAAEQRLITEALRSFQLSGVNLPDAEQARFKAIQQTLTEVQTQFSENLLDATNEWTLTITDETMLVGIPATSLAMFKQSAEKKALDGWLITLQFPSYHAVMSYAENRELREKVYRAYATRAAEFDHVERDNAPLLQRIVALKQEKARLLGFDNYTDLSLDSKMADDADQVLAFLRDLAQRARPAAERDLCKLRDFAAQHASPQNDLQAWDIAYYSEQLKQARYALSDEDLRPYFPLPEVIKGLFSVAEALYNVQIQAADADTWHDDVRFFAVQRDGQTIGQFYLDSYAREHKRGGAWMDVCRSKIGDEIPVAYLTCNATPPVGDQPALQTHDEVITLFHEFGHGLHHMLTTIRWPSVSGISGVEWDAVELPSQLMENWAWERLALDRFAKHYQTGESIPDELYQKMLMAKNFQSGLATLRQVEFALFDLLIYQQDHDGSRIREILQQVRNDVAVLPSPEFNRFENSFSHIFAGGYSAGYYSYKWAEVLAADAFAAFEETHVFDQDTGQKFLQEFLSRGGSAPAAVLYRNFRGRDANVDALLKQSGLLDEVAVA